MSAPFVCWWCIFFCKREWRGDQKEGFVFVCKGRNRNDQAFTTFAMWVFFDLIKDCSQISFFRNSLPFWSLRSHYPPEWLAPWTCSKSCFLCSENGLDSPKDWHLVVFCWLKCKWFLQRKRFFWFFVCLIVTQSHCLFFQNRFFSMFFSLFFLVLLVFEAIVQQPIRVSSLSHNPQSS